MLRFIVITLLLCGLISCGDLSPDRGDATAYREGEMLVKFRAGLPEEGRFASHSRIGAERIDKVGTRAIDRIKLPEGVSVEQAVQMYKEDPDIEYAEPNYLIKASVIPNDTFFNQLWGLDNTGQIIEGISGTPDADIDAPEAWDFVNDASSVIVAIADTGVDEDHPDISGNLIEGYDFINGDTEPEDENGHGTHLAGTIGAIGNNAKGVTGVNWGIRILPMKVLDETGEGTVAELIQAIDFAAAKGTRIFNMSFGGSGESFFLYETIKAYQNILFVAAAGNGGDDGIGDDNDITPEYPASFDLPNILAVAATDQDDSLAPFSNYGQLSVDVASPGVNVLSTIPSFTTGISYQGSYGLVYFSFGFEGIDGESSRNAVMQRVLDFHDIGINDRVLVVDDDGNGNPDYTDYEDFYEQSLQELGYSYDVYIVPNNNTGPDVEIMELYPLVIWFTGDAFSNTLMASDQLRLQTYLDTGGRLFLTGQDIGYDMVAVNGTGGAGSFYQEYLHAQYVTDDANGRTFTGEDDFQGLHIDLPLQSGNGARNQFFIDAIEPIGSASAFFIQYDDAYQFFEGTSMATAVASGVSSLVASYYSHFNPSEIKGTVMETVDGKDGLLSKVLSGGRINVHNAIASLRAPSDLTASLVGETQVVLTWSDNASQEDGYMIERKESNGQFSTIGTVQAGQTSYTDIAVEGGKLYTYRVKAFNEVAGSAYSNDASVSVPGGGNGTGGNSGGGGGCSIGTARNYQTAIADMAIVFLPVLIIFILKKK